MPYKRISSLPKFRKGEKTLTLEFTDNDSVFESETINSDVQSGKRFAPTSIIPIATVLEPMVRPYRAPIITRIAFRNGKKDTCDFVSLHGQFFSFDERGIEIFLGARSLRNLQTLLHADHSL